MREPVIGISMGDPGGIGPEVIIKALADDAVRRVARFRVFGQWSPLRAAAERAGVAIHPDIDVVESQGGCDAPAPAADDARSGRLSFAWVEDVIAAALLPRHDSRRVDAVVTGPISKRAWAMAGHGDFPGHTELLAARCGAARHAMMFHAPAAERGPGLNVILVTAHVPLSQVPVKLSTARVLETIRLGAEAMQRLGVARPRIAVCGLNPHAGEHGVLGREDDDVIAPAVDAARAEGLAVSGPHPADTIFSRALSTPRRPAQFDLVVAMYHDQGLIPLKTLAWDRAVNMTVGLPFVRTSPDHGTAFDIAGKNTADPGSMKAALMLAVRSCLSAAV